jgi:hypothetical protein
MTLDAKVRPKLNELPPVNGTRQRFDLTVPELGKVALDVQTLEKLGAELWELTVEPAAPRTLALADHAKVLAARLTGLLEPLTLIECDTVRGEAMLRSQQPAKQENDLFFYELMVRQEGQSTLRRYQHQIGNTPRKQVPFVLTREALAKGIADLATPVT